MKKIINESSINQDICRKCGGKCCLKCGCDYYVNDFEVVNKEELVKKLDTGNVSIVSAVSFDLLPNNKITATPFLYLRARNVDRDVVDLLSLKKKCSMLREDGCSYSLSERPSGGLSLIPDKDGHCSMNISPESNIALWGDYQKLLSRLVKRYANMSVEERFRIDVENLLYDMITKNFDGVSEIELMDIRKGLPLLINCYPKEYEKAKVRALK